MQSRYNQKPHQFTILVGLVFNIRNCLNMKIILSLISISIALFSCNEERITANKLAGTWRVERVSYSTEKGELKEVAASVVLSNKVVLEESDDNVYHTRPAMQIMGKDTVRFLYSLGGKPVIHFSMTKSQSEALPMLGIGRVQGYTYQFSGRNNLRISTEKEFLEKEQAILSDVSYFLVREN
jgi:hypothetical protein